MNESTGRERLPLNRYDQLPLPELHDRIRRLNGDDLARGAEPSPGGADPRPPQTAPSPGRQQPVSPQTSGPKVNPPSHGVPSNPAQPRQ